MIASALPLFALALSGCYEHAPRRGPLAALADSVAPEGASLTCVATAETERLAGEAPYHLCALAGKSTVSLEIGRGGKVYSVLQMWGLDSAGRVRTADAAASLTKLVGTPRYEGDDEHGNWVRHWSTDTLCVDLVELRRARIVQLIRSTPDAYGRSACPTW